MSFEKLNELLEELENVYAKEVDEFDRAKSSLREAFRRMKHLENVMRTVNAELSKQPCAS